MFDGGVAEGEGISLLAVVTRVRALPVAADDGGLVDQIDALEQLKRAASALQAQATAALVASRRAAHVAAGVPADRVGRGVAEQVALARRESPHRGGRFVGLSQALVHEMPETFAALRAGRISEWGATGVVRETATLQLEDRTETDARLAPLLGRASVSDGALARAARGIAHGLDASAATRRTAKAEADRRVTIRPAPDTMVVVSALLPVAEGVSVFAALSRAAAAAGDPRGRGQLMADTLVARVTGRDPLLEPVPVHVDLVMTDAALLGADDSAATVRSPRQAPVPVPAPVARRLVAAAGANGTAWLRRLFTRPDASALTAVESRRRLFPRGLAEVITLVDQTCRTPWCDAPIADADHVVPHARGGRTDLENSQGLCRRCNLAKEAPGWSAARDPDGTVRTTTPTGHEYSSERPPVLGWPPTRAVALPAAEALDDPPPVIQLDFAEARWHRRAAS